MKWLRNTLLTVGLVGSSLAVVTPVHALDVTPYTPPIVLDDSPVITTGYGFTGAPDYVQLYNASDQPVDLHNFRLELITKEKGMTELVTLKNWLAPSN